LTEKAPTIYTIGHSTRTLEEFAGLLRENGIALLVDVRTVPRSRHNPQFDTATLPEELEEAGIRYEHAKGLGGWRKTVPGSPNAGWRSLGFRGYADYMLTGEFEAQVARLIDKAGKEALVIMCAEAVPWRCHRQLISDALVVRGIRVLHIMGRSKLEEHSLTAWAKVEGARIIYPAEQLSLDIG
jgi:uncharacterized protein (DUF488 family)